MESLLLLLIPLACPLAMGAMGLAAWTWAKMRSTSENLTGVRQVKGEV